MKLTDINVENISDEIIRKVLFDFKNGGYDRGDCLIIFGCHLKELLDERLDTAIKIFNKKDIDKILVTGGVGIKGDFNEAEYMVNYLVRSGINFNNLIIENKSRTTEENVIYSIGLLKEKGFLKDRSLVLVSSQAHLRRISMLLKKHLKGIDCNIYYEFPEASIISYENLLVDGKLRNMGKNEIKKIVSFVEQGFLDDEDV